MVLLEAPHYPAFLAARDPAVLTRVLGIVYRAIEGHIVRTAGLTRQTGLLVRDLENSYLTFDPTSGSRRRRARSSSGSAAT